MAEHFITPKIEVYTPAGVLVDDYYTDGQIDDWVSLNFTLGCRGGCLGGELVLLGDIFETPTLADEAQIRVYGPDDNVCWRGFTLAREMRVEGDNHRYVLHGYWHELETVAMPGQLEVGAEITEDDDGAESGVVRQSGLGTVSAVVQWLADTYIAPQLGVTVSVASNTTPVAKLTINGDQMNRVLETLEAIASGANYDAAAGTGRELWVSLIDEGGVFRFVEVDLTATAVLTLQVGDDSASLQESGYVGRRQRAVNRVSVVGRRLAEIQRRMRVDVSGNYSIGLWGGRPRRIYSSPFVSRAADANRLANGLLAWYDDEVEGLEDGVQDIVDGAACPKPWAGPGVWSTVNQGERLRDYISLLQVQYSDVFEVSMTLGVEPATEESGSLLPEGEDDVEGVDELPPGDDEEPGVEPETPIGATGLLPHDHGRRQSGGPAGFLKGNR